MKRNRIFNFVGFALIISYPFLVWTALYRHFSLRWLSLLLGSVVLCTFLRHRQRLFLLTGLALCLALLIFNQPVFLKIYPVLMNALVCGFFTVSLRHKPLITLFAERMGYTLDQDGLIYTRRATQAWAVFMACQTVISCITVFLSDTAWALYNGLISYLCIGLMMAGEYLVRQRRRHA